MENERMIVLSSQNFLWGKIQVFSLSNKSKSIWKSLIFWSLSSLRKNAKVSFSARWPTLCESCPFKNVAERKENFEKREMSVLGEERGKTDHSQKALYNWLQSKMRRPYWLDIFALTREIDSERKITLFTYRRFFDNFGVFF